MTKIEKLAGLVETCAKALNVVGDMPGTAALTLEQLALIMAEPDDIAMDTDRRAEVLELAGRLAVADITREAPTFGANQGETREDFLKRTHAIMGGVFVSQALAIINAVDEAVGTKASEADDPVMPWKVTEPDQNGEYGVWRGRQTCAIEGVHRPMADAICDTLNALAARGVKL